MKNKNPLLVPELRKILTAGDTNAIRDFCKKGHPAVIADLISALSAEEAWVVFGHVDLRLRVEIFNHLNDDLMVEIIEKLQIDEISLLRYLSNPCQRVPGIYSACDATWDYRLWPGHLIGCGSMMPKQNSLNTIGFAFVLALGLQVVTSTLIAALLPLAAARANFDPAVVASPAVATIVDITGLLIYFMTVKLVLGI